MPKVKKRAEFDFEKGLFDLEKIVEAMEHGNSTLEQSLEQFSKAVQLIKSCQTKLKEAEQRIQILLNTGQQDTLVPFVVEAEELPSG
jgi:exodeoxyribonuclease VII small subunit